MLKSISALAYNIDKINAKQVPMTQYLRELFTEENSKKNINSFSSQRYFMEVLSDVIEDIDTSLIDRTILILNRLNVDDLNDNENRLEEIWDYLTSQKTSQRSASLKFEEEHKILLKRGNDKNRKSLLKYLCDSYQNHPELKGADYYQAISQLRDFISNENLSLDLQKQLKDTDVEPEVFVNYIEEARDEYLDFKLICDNSSLNQYLIEQLPDKITYTSFFDQLSDSTYDLMAFSNELRKHIPTLTSDNFYWLVNAYKALFIGKPLDVLLDKNQIATIQTTIADKATLGYYDISAMALGHNMVVNIDVNDDDTIKEIAERIECYHMYGPLLLSGVAWNNPILNKVLIELTTDRKGISTADIVNILPQFEQIVSLLNIEPELILDRLNYWHKDAERDINPANIEQIVSYKFYSYSIKSKNNLTKHIHKIAKLKLAEIDPNILFQQREQPAYYWLTTAETLINGNIIRTLPDNLVEFVKKIFKDFSSTGIKPNSVIDSIINKMHPSKITATIKAIATEYYSGKKTINAQMFIYFEPYFREPNRIKGHEGDFIITILDKIVLYLECRNLFMQNSEFYAAIVKIAGDDAENFKTNIKELCKSQPTAELNNFARSIGLSVEGEEGES